MFRKTKGEQHLVQWKTARSEFKGLVKKTRRKTRKILPALLLVLLQKSSLEQSKAVENANIKNISFLEISEAHYKHSRSIGNKVGETLA